MVPLALGRFGGLALFDLAQFHLDRLPGPVIITGRGGAFLHRGGGLAGIRGLPQICDRRFCICQEFPLFLLRHDRRLRLELLLQSGDGVMLLEKADHSGRQLFQVVMELEAKLFMEQFTQANGRVLEDPGQILRVVQVIFNKVLHLFQHGAVARPGREGQPVAVNLAVQHIVDGNLDRAARLVSVPVFLVYRLHPGLRLGQRHAGASGKMLVGALHDGDDGFLFRGQVGQGGLLGGFEQGHKRPGNITGEVPPAGGRAPDGAKAIFEKATQAARARAAAKKARELVRRKSALETSRMPGKLADCREKDPSRTEIFIVEGDSAGGSAKMGRDSAIQAILPLWGKMLNVEKARADKIYGNDKLMPVVLALGCGIGDEFDISKLRYDKVFIMADADVDGSHICTLMLTFFFRYMRPLIEQGHVYVAQPPLFKVQKGNTIKYAYNDAEMAVLSQEMPGAKVNRYKGLGEMNPEQLWETTMNPDNRVIVQITIDDAEKADEAFTILMGDQVEPRRRFIETNAQYAKLDV